MTQTAASGRASRRRGYKWENHVVRSLRAAGWGAERVGAAGAHLPDVVAWEPGGERCSVIECKATTQDAVLVPPQELQRLTDWLLGPFRLWRDRSAVLACRFLRRMSERPRTVLVAVEFTRNPVAAWPNGITVTRAGSAWATGTGRVPIPPATHGDGLSRYEGAEFAAV